VLHKHTSGKGRFSRTALVECFRGASIGPWYAYEANNEYDGGGDRVTRRALSLGMGLTSIESRPAAILAMLAFCLSLLVACGRDRNRVPATGGHSGAR